jgi:hypothetical protein
MLKQVKLLQISETQIARKIRMKLFPGFRIIVRQSHSHVGRHDVERTRCRQRNKPFGTGNLI